MARCQAVVRSVPTAWAAVVDECVAFVWKSSKTEMQIWGRSHRQIRRTEDEDGGRRRKTTVLITALRTAALNGIKRERGE